MDTAIAQLKNSFDDSLVENELIYLALSAELRKVSLNSDRPGIVNLMPSKIKNTPIIPTLINLE
jgi:hypothetical protein